MPSGRHNRDQVAQTSRQGQVEQSHGEVHQEGAGDHTKRDVEACGDEAESEKSFPFIARLSEQVMSGWHTKNREAQAQNRDLCGTFTPAAAAVLKHTRKYARIDESLDPGQPRLEKGPPGAQQPDRKQPCPRTPVCSLQQIGAAREPRLMKREGGYERPQEHHGYGAADRAESGEGNEDHAGKLRLDFPARDERTISPARSQLEECSEY